MARKFTTKTREINDLRLVQTGLITSKMLHFQTVAEICDITNLTASRQPVDRLSKATGVKPARAKALQACAPI